MIRFIDLYRDRFGVEFLCRTLRAAVRGFLTSRGYRAAKTRQPSARQLRDELLIPEIQRLHAENYGVYGVRKMHALLKRAGWKIGRDQTARLMKLARVEGVTRRAKTFTTKKDPAGVLPTDLVNRAFKVNLPRCLWVADITYVATWRIPAVVATLGVWSGHGGTEIQLRAETGSACRCRSRGNSSCCRNSGWGVTAHWLSVGETGRDIDLAQFAKEILERGESPLLGTAC